MTLDTRIYVHDRVPAQEVFGKLCELVTGPPRPGTRVTSDERSVMNDPGQGFDAWIIIYRDIEGKAPHRAEPEGHDEECDEDCSYGHPPACWLEASLDTAYGYHGADGDCGSLHARLVRELGEWLDARGALAWSWRNEFTGEVHQRFDGLGELGGM